MSEETYQYPNSKASLTVIEPPRTPPLGAAAAPATPNGVDSTPSPVDSIQKKLLEGKIIEVLHTIYDPEIPVNIYELGLIYEINIATNRDVQIKMTLTAPGCPVAGDIVAQVQRKVAGIDEVNDAEVQLVWDPPWTKDRLSETARLTLGF